MENSSVATTLFNIAQQWSNLGEYQKALEQFERVLGITLFIFIERLLKIIIQKSSRKRSTKPLRIDLLPQLLQRLVNSGASSGTIKKR